MLGLVRVDLEARDEEGDAEREAHRLFLLQTIVCESSEVGLSWDNGG